MSARLKFKFFGFVMTAVLLVTATGHFAKADEPNKNTMKTSSKVASPAAVTPEQEVTNLKNALSRPHALGGNGAGASGFSGLGVGSNAPAMGGSNIGGSDRASSCVIGDASALSDAKSCVGLDIISGNLSDARDALVQGLSIAIAHLQEQAGSADLQSNVAFRIYIRGMEIVSGIDQVLSNDPTRLETEVKVLRAYYDFAQSKVRELASNGSIDSSELAQAQMSWLIDGYTTSLPSADGKGLEIHAQHVSDAVYLKMAELITGYAATDLKESSLNASCGSLSDELSSLSQRLARHNLGDQAAYLNDSRYAINLSYPQIHEGAASIASGCGK